MCSLAQYQMSQARGGGGFYVVSTDREVPPGGVLTYMFSIGMCRGKDPFFT